MLQHLHSAQDCWILGVPAVARVLLAVGHLRHRTQRFRQRQSHPAYLLHHHAMLLRP